MEKQVLHKISFGSFIKLFVLGGLGLGIFSGIIALINGLFGGPVTANLFGTMYYGIVAGILNLFIFPIVFMIVFCLFSIFTYPFFILILKIRKGITLNVLISPVNLKINNKAENEEDAL